MSEPRPEQERIFAEMREIEDEIVRLLERRAQASVRLKETGSDADPLRLARRELETLARLRTATPGTLSTRAVEAVFIEILSACRNLEIDDKIAVLGPEGDFAEIAALARFGTSARTTVVPTVQEVFDEVERKRAVFGVVPLETASEGLLHQTLDLLLSTSLTICGEIELDTSLELLSRTGNAGDVEKVYGHAAALLRCRHYLEEHLPKVPLVDVRSATMAAQLAAEDHGAAALGTSLSGRRFELRTIQSKVQDDPGARTRFVIMGRLVPRPTGQDRTTLLASTKDGPGALFEALRPFADRGINLTKIESRRHPANVADIVFFLDIDGHVTDRAVTSAVEDARRVTRMVKVIGSYPKR
jgi:chorismate mutase / prephenate dehydratase